MGLLSAGAWLLCGKNILYLPNLSVVLTLCQVLGQSSGAGTGCDPGGLEAQDRNLSPDLGTRGSIQGELPRGNELPQLFAALQG